MVFNKPDIFGVGASRCGTTTLYGMLVECDGVLAPAKELNGFGVIQHAPDYEDRFQADRRYPHAADVTPVYLSQPIVCDRIRAYAPEAKIIILVRDPLERFLSHCRHVGVKRDDLRDFTHVAGEQFENDAVDHRDWSSPGKILCQSFYARHLDVWRKTFGEDRCLVLQFEEMETWPARLSEFLGFDVSLPRTDRYRNASKGETDRDAWRIALARLHRHFFMELEQMEQRGVHVSANWRAVI